ncbi:hypothetical protein LZ30DRAFT_387462 [Colletotrichum cereale]|nr:hypothetical protein LZ30DRAFT_387462 [Colletotrichum cereale]
MWLRGNNQGWQPVFKPMLSSQHDWDFSIAEMPPLEAAYSWASPFHFAALSLKQPILATTLPDKTRYDISAIRISNGTETPTYHAISIQRGTGWCPLIIRFRVPSQHDDLNKDQVGHIAAVMVMCPTRSYLHCSNHKPPLSTLGSGVIMNGEHTINKVTKRSCAHRGRSC